MLQEIVELTKKLIAIPSVSGDIPQLHKALELVKSELKGFTIEEFECNGVPSILVYKESKRPEKFKMILNGHLDVVPAKKEQFTPFEKEGKLYGRGASDMKSGVSAIILLFKELAETLSYSIGLQIVCDEEVAGYEGTKYQIQKGVKADFVIAAEPTRLRIVHQAKGIVWAKITTSGVAAHGARPWEGKSAIWRMKKILDKIEQKYPEPEVEEWKTTINVAAIENKNRVFNKVAEDCKILLDIRHIPEDKEAVLTFLKSFENDHTKVELEFVDPVHFVDKNHPYIQKLANVFTAVLKKSPNIDVNPGASDVRHFTEAGYAGIVFGPVGGAFHADGEWVDIKSLDDYYQILKNFLLAV